MVGPSKILTVSYGTFSCTLEGFDEPFSTMKAIAEYFRDLAAEDRYFGAEPPTPDAEMLHRIAEREIKRRVEAKIEDNGVVLRAHIGGPVQADAPPASRQRGTDDIPSPRMPQGASHEDRTVPPVVMPEPAPAMFSPPPAADVTLPDIGSIAGISEKLQRIRAAVAQSRAFETSEDDQPAVSDEARRAEAERLAAEEAGRAVAARLAAEEAERAEAERRAAEEAERAEAERRAAEEAERAEAARLAAEEAERAEAERLAAEEAERAEAERRAAEEAERAEAERLAAEEAERAEAERRAAEEAERAEAERLAAEEAERAEAERRAAEEAERAEAERRAAVEAETRPRRRVVVVRPARPAAPQPQAIAAEAAAEPAPETEAEDTPEPVETAQSDSLEERVARALGETGLTDEDEAELLRELVAVEREAEEMRANERRRRELLQDTRTEAAVDRLISQADSQLQQPEAQRRQSTISHLKAAVVATRADAAEGNHRDTRAEAQEMARYREDLARTVRPGPEDSDSMLRRPQRPAALTERPRTVQAPLVLVSEQRIDRPAEVEAVRPRRVSAGALAMEELFDEDDAPQAAQVAPGRAFVDFVAPHNLSTLNETIEAAAAYVTHVEGCPEFTRPQVMRHVVATGAPMTRSRENLLRSFGLLLRQGMIRRARRGQFELAPESDFAGLARRFAQRG
ncbi:hypothetical protein [Pararhodobacter sp.]|uniref:hypothetical protein n=1 Tax=Pararhodobacter sp. TaxID=2127056 RepID=UPI002FDEBBF9